MTVITPGGILDEHLMGELDALVAARGDASVVIDLSDCTLADLPVLDRLDPHRWGRTAGNTCIACARLSGRQLMARAGVTQRLSVFQRVADALQMRVLAHAGFGSGWADDSVPEPAVAEGA